MPLRTLHDHQGDRIDLATQLASGGEGTVFAVAGDLTRLAKVYHQPPDPRKAEKLHGMVGQAMPELCRFTAWPTATLHEGPGGRLVGFVMPRFDGFRPIHTLYSPAHRRVAFPEADWSFLVAAAMNSAAAFDAVHEKGHVVGDVNQSNVLVSRQALACLIDCDSFQIVSEGNVFRCEVGVGPYTPSELQGINFRQVDRTVNHDRFGLAVLIFHLLFMGRHPFAGRYLGQGDLSLEQAIAEYRFVYSQADTDTRMTAPPFSLPLRVLSPRLAELFERAFRRGAEKPGARPTAAEWHAGLSEFQSQLRTCPKDSGHKVPGHATECPWCGFLERGGPNFFLGAGADVGAYQADLALLTRLWDQLQNLKPESFSMPALVLPPPGPPPVPPLGPRIGRALARVRWSRVGVWGFLLLFFLGTLLIWPFSPSGFWSLLVTVFWRIFPALILGGWLSDWLKKVEGWLERRFPREDPRRFVWELQALAQEWNWQFRRYQGEFRRIKEGPRNVKKEANELPILFRNERHELEKLAVQRRARERFEAIKSQVDPAQEAQAREDYLRNCFLSDHKIPNFGSGRITLLASYGVETAFDLTEESLAEIRGIGPKLRQTLMTWKKQRLKDFHYDPARIIPGTRLSEIPPEEMRGLVIRFKQREEVLRSQLQKTIQDLTSLTRHTEQELQGLVQKRNELAVRAMRAGADPRMLGP